MQMQMDNDDSTNFRGRKDKEEILKNYLDSTEHIGSVEYEVEGFSSIEGIGQNNYHEGLDFGFKNKIQLENYDSDDYNVIEKSITGNYFIVFAKNNFPRTDEQLNESLSIFSHFLEKKEIITDNIDQIPLEDFFQGDNFYYFKDLGVVYTSLTDNQVKKIESQKNFFYVEPERIVEAVGNKNSSGQHNVPLNNSSTWGVNYIKGNKSQNQTGYGVNVAVLDSGFDNTHPDYKHRKVVSKTFLGQTADDFYGHGMHCTGIAFGYKDVAKNIRYGIAPDSNIHSAKILNQNGYGVMSDIILALDWAVKKKCKVTLLSVGISNNGARLPSPAVHSAIYQARLNHCIVVAAAGNDSRRSFGDIKPLASPSDAQLSISVGAIDSLNRIYNNCNRADQNYGQIMDFVAPGLDIYSSWSLLSKTNPISHNCMSGTSMAAPFVAGIIALLWEKYPNALSKKILYQLRINPKVHLSWTDDRDFGTGVPRLP